MVLEILKDIATPEDLKIIEDAWLEMEFDESELSNPLDVLYSGEMSEDWIMKFVWLLSQPENIHTLCKYIFNIEIPPIQSVILQEIWDRKFPMLVGSRGMGKTFMLSLYAMLRAFLMPGRKIVIVGSAFRQSKFLFDYMKTIWDNAPVLKSLCKSTDGPKQSVDRCIFNINGSVITCLPLGSGDKIRGQRANDIIADEFASIPRDIFETVVAGFANVSSSPIEKSKREFRIAKAKQLGYEIPEISFDPLEKGNQIILSGTAYYDFNHFADYWKKHKKIIEAGNNKEKLYELFGGEVPKGFNRHDYSIIRIPVDVLPVGFMDTSQIARAKATVHSGVFEMEYKAIFTTDSTGFFKRSVIERCVVGPDSDISLPSGKPFFTASLTGKKTGKYVMAVDANAQGEDNFCITIVEVHPDHRRIVYCWTTNRQKHKTVMNKELTKEQDYYSFCARKIRDLMKVFPCEEIAMDSQGGGFAVYESLHDADKIEEGEQLIWEIIEEDKEKDTDHKTGLHIVRLINFADSKWMSESNQKMRKDFEDQLLLFPYFDAITLGISAEKDYLENRIYDTLEDTVMEIEKMKDELAMIIHTETANGRDKFDTPEAVVGVGKKEKVRKDRYCALLMANWSARNLDLSGEEPYSGVEGGFAENRSEMGGPLYSGPEWFTRNMENDIY